MDIQRVIENEPPYLEVIHSTECAIIHGPRVDTPRAMFTMLHEIGHIKAQIASQEDSFMLIYCGIVSLPSLREEVAAWHIAAKAINKKYKQAFIITAVSAFHTYLYPFLKQSGLRCNSKAWKEQKLHWTKEVVELLVNT